MTNTSSVKNPTSVPVIEEIADRWSPRAFDTEYVIPEQDLVALFEAARWAASGNNGQPWKFIVAARGTEAFDKLFTAVAPWNTEWAARASALVAVLVDVRGEDGILPVADQRSRFYDVGLAVSSLALEGESRGLHIHQTAGTSIDALRAEFGFGDEYEVATSFGIGRLATDDVPADLAASDAAPRERRALADIVDIHI